MSAPAPISASPPKSRPIALYLFVLALVALVPAFGFSAILLQRNNEAQERVVETLTTGSLKSIAQAIDREVAGSISTLKVLATSTNIQAADLAGFYNQVNAALGGTQSYVFVVDSAYQAILSTRQNFPMTPVPSSDVASIQKALDSKGVVVSGLVTGSVSRRQVFNVLFPVFTGKLAPLVIGISRDAETLENALLSDKLPDGWNVAIVDSNGTMIAASEGAGETGGHFGLTDINSLSTTSGLISLTDSKDSYRAAVRKSMLTGWTLVAWAPQSVIARPLMEAVWSLAVGGLLLAAVVVLIVYWVTLQIGSSVRGLESDAKRLGQGQPVMAQNYPITEIASISTALEEAGKRRQQSETEVRFLMRELAHRSKNQMTVIAAMAKQTARGAENVPEFVQNFEKRIFGLARSTDLLLANGVVGVDLRELITGQIDPLSPMDSGRVTLEGAPFRLNNQAAQIIGMAAHELATNAAKYGAFRRADGRLDVTWTRQPETLDLNWREHVTDPAPPSERKGFGTTVLESMVGRSLGAEVVRTVHPDGIEWNFAIPLSSIDASRAPEEVARAAQ